MISLLSERFNTRCARAPDRYLIRARDGKQTMLDSLDFANDGSANERPQKTNPDTNKQARAVSAALASVHFLFNFMCIAQS